jgi:bidirectional [NiFe] hydrogenase diaphorase subunit
MPQKKISIRIDGELVTVLEGQTVLEAARTADKTIPTLCYLEGLTPDGACRLCMVEVAGTERLLPACTTPVQEGLSVTTTSARLTQYRRMTVELLLIERNHVCSVCVSNGHCELQAMATQLGVTNTRYWYDFPTLPLDMSHERFVLDHNRCILCSRCVRVCRELEGANVWDIGRRGIHSRVISDLNQPWGDSQNCTSCGKCVQACPTGALAEKGAAVEEMTKRTDHLTRLAGSKRAHA